MIPLENNNIPAGYKDSAVGIIPQEWEVKRLGACFSIGHGRDYKHLSNGDIPVYGSGGIICYVGSFLHDGETVCIGRKGTINKPFYYNGPIWTVDTLFYTHSFQSVLPRYVGYLFDSIDWMRYNEATGVPSLTAKTISNIKKAMPPLAEQRKIAEILGVWDEAIEKQSRLIEKLELRKHALMQRLLTGRTRLPGFTAPWQKCLYSDILKEVKRTMTWDDNKEYDLISVKRRSGGLFHRDRLLGKDIKTKNLRPAKCGDFLISKMQIVHGASGLVTEEFDEMKISGSYIALVARNGDMVDMKFINWYSKTPYFYHQTYVSSYGVHIEKMTFDLESFMSMNIMLPPFPEQKAIAEVLTTADDEIATHRKKLDALRQQKRGLMQQLLTGKTRVKI